ncbi:clathrin adaptor complexes medium subunit family protein [Medicago truncatula]|uniref:Clathrin adaptor complexes medium subunit family protein n=1 Tax=Medicago truncatula TaxID=3880 RepID=G7JVQ2_MEDTR|nr:clathrin adaptor complexes medium subunit family protein [Medicago truncatula]
MGMIDKLTTKPNMMQERIAPPNIVKQMDATINRGGTLVKCEINGEVQVNSHITGLPNLTLLFVNHSFLDDVRFHPCVRFRP